MLAGSDLIESQGRKARSDSRSDRDTKGKVPLEGGINQEEKYRTNCRLTKDSHYY